jgi:2,3-bisphosphoglycerate-independent phosphoglycerate mutase
MRRAVLIIPHWLSQTNEQSFLRGRLPALQFLADNGEMRKCSPMPIDPEIESGRASLTPEAALLGMEPSGLQMQDGPLTVSSLGADPPEKSVHFHLSLLSWEDGIANAVKRPPPEELREVLEASRKLNTRFLTVVEGEASDHGLVWEEGSIDLGTQPARKNIGKEMKDLLPEGDGEKLLRRFIDDSINLLSSLELNKRREGEGLEPINLWWPWGQGFRVPVPNLALRRGEVTWVQSRSLRLQGLTRLAGYRHSDRNTFGYATKTNLESILKGIETYESTITCLDAFSVFRTHSRWEECDWFTKELDQRLFSRLRDLANREKLNLTIVACGGWIGEQIPPTAESVGLVLTFDSGKTRPNSVPFDERALEERSIGNTNVWEAVQQTLA